jgi:pimeloyl-ACP methyl ester carboxylesterase
MTEPLQVRARGLVFDALAAGPATGEPVVLLHGFPQTAACWTRCWRRWRRPATARSRPTSSGYSPKARPTRVQAYRLLQLVADVVAVADRLGAGRFHLVGHDWAAWWPGAWQPGTPTGWAP